MIQKTKSSSFKRYNINVESLRSLPANVYWKNEEGIYLGCNDRLVEVLKLDSEKDFIGSRLSDYPHVLNSNIYERTDNSIMQNGRSLCLIEETVKEKYSSYFTTKLPLLDQNGKISGLIGISFNIEQPLKINDISSILLSRNLFTQSNYVHQVHQAFYTNLSDQGIHLTVREKQCLQFLTQGRTMKEIGKFLKISSRTAEAHINSIKRKFNCATKSQLLDRLSLFMQ